MRRRNHMQTALMTIFQFTPEEVMEIRVRIGARGLTNRRRRRPPGSEFFIPHNKKKRRRRRVVKNAIDFCVRVCSKKQENHNREAF